MESTETKICRLCFSTQGHLIDIFNENNLNVVEIIDGHIGEICRTDALPKCICSNCWKKVEDFHLFHCSVLIAQEEYLQQMFKCKTENTSHEVTEQLSFVEVAEQTSFVDVTDQPSFVEVTDQQDFVDATEQTSFVEVATNYHEFMEECPIKPDELYTYENQTKSCELTDVLCNETPIVNKTESQQSDGELTDNDSEETSTIIDPKTTEIDSAESKAIFSEHFDTTCDVCSIDLKSLKYAILHYKNEHQNEEGYIKCCGLKIKRDNLLKDHIRWHINPEIFKCRYCDRIMKTKLSLATHIAKHRNSRRFICDICGKVFKEIYQIRIHMNSHLKASVCHICSKSFATKRKLREHVMFYHNPDEIRIQITKLQEVKKITLDVAKIEEVISTHFDMKCENCNVIFKSLQEAQYHYMHEHQIADGYVQCCGLKFRKVINIEGHVLWHLKPDLFKCCICNKESTTVCSLKSHLRVHEVRPSPQQNVCKKCNKTFSIKHHLTRHMQLMHKIVTDNKKKNLNAVHPDSSSLKLFFDMQCDVCKIELSSLQHAKHHYLQEHNIPDGYIKCCEIKFRELKHINDHLEYHINPNIFECTVCVKAFPRKSDLSAHMSQHKAMDTKKFTCNACGKVWNSKYRLQVHQRSHMEKVARTFPCDYCNRKFSTEKLQQSHTFRIHEADRQVKTEICEYCAKTFTGRQKVLSHIRTMHMETSIRRERVQCEICQAWLSNRYTLKEHMIRHNSEPQKCPQCDKISPNPHALERHIRDVHCERLFQCHLCSKTFKAAVALKDHVATHTGEKMYKCSFCTEAFIWRPNMYSHQKKAHPNEWQKKKKRNENKEK